MIRVLIADDHALMRELVAGLLEAQHDITVVGGCADGGEVLALATATAPDVLLMDVRMPVMPGVAATLALKSVLPTVKVLMFTGLMDRAVLAAARRAGAVGYLLKSGDPGRLIAAVRVVAAGGTAWPDEDVGPAVPPALGISPGTQFT